MKQKLRNVEVQQISASMTAKRLSLNLIMRMTKVSVAIYNVLVYKRDITATMSICCQMNTLTAMTVARQWRNWNAVSDLAEIVELMTNKALVESEQKTTADALETPIEIQNNNNNRLNYGCLPCYLNLRYFT